MSDKIFHGDVGNIYYQLYKSKHLNDLITICCMQDFDECDYDQLRFCRNSKNEIHCFESEEMAVQKLNEWFEPDQIDPEYRIDLIRE